MAEWRDRIVPILEEEETHPVRSPIRMRMPASIMWTAMTDVQVFDIAKYGQNILQKISVHGK